MSESAGGIGGHWRSGDDAEDGEAVDEASADLPLDFGCFRRLCGKILVFPFFRRLQEWKIFDFSEILCVDWRLVGINDV